MVPWGRVLAEGATIGTYRLLHRIGEGGMGVVYAGEHTLLGRRAAVKVLRPSLSVNEELLKRFFNEARAVSRIADPGIVQIFDFGHAADGSAFIVMELLRGEAMDKRLKRIRRFGLIECVRLVRLICSSLGVVHARGIVHRDLKPGNIFLVADPAVTGGERVKILDFGIAKLSEDEPGSLGEVRTGTGVLLGTPMYMSPEQCRGHGNIDHRSDIYTMACVMFAMLTGRPPFAYKGPGEQIAAHLREPAPLASSRVPGVPPAIDQIIDRCLRKSPDERFQSMAEVIRALDAAERTLGGSVAATEAGEATAVLGSDPDPLPEMSITTAPGQGQPPAPAMHTLPAPTTLHDASGQAAATPVQVRRRRDRSGRRWLAALAIGAAAAIAVITVSVSGGGDASTSAPLPGAPVGPRAGSSGIDAAPAAEPSRAPAVGDAVTAPPDAGAADAAPASEVIDAAVRPSPRSPPRSKPSGKGPVRPRTEGDHALPTGSAEPIIDRGD
jgi:tRNA A-37 threonylcarbamoyl transferase component Bud32